MLLTDPQLSHAAVGLSHAYMYLGVNETMCVCCFTECKLVYWSIVRSYHNSYQTWLCYNWWQKVYNCLGNVDIIQEKIGEYYKTTSTSLVPRPPPLFILQFIFSIIHGSGRTANFSLALPFPCIILNANRRTKTGEAWECG